MSIGTDIDTTKFLERKFYDPMLSRNASINESINSISWNNNLFEIKRVKKNRWKNLKVETPVVNFNKINFNKMCEELREVESIMKNTNTTFIKSSSPIRKRKFLSFH